MCCGCACVGETVVYGCVRVCAYVCLLLCATAKFQLNMIYDLDMESRWFWLRDGSYARSTASFVSGKFMFSEMGGRGRLTNTLQTLQLVQKSTCLRYG